MKPHYFACLPLTIGAAFSAAALAQTDNTITFTGSVEQPTCVIKITGTDAGNTINLGAVKTTDFPTVGNRKNQKSFNVQLTGCPAGVKPFAHFYTSEDNLDKDNTLRNIPGNAAADGIAVALLTKNKKPYKIQTTPNPKRAHGDPAIPTTEDGSAELTYYAEFVRTGVMTPGVFNAQLSYIINYD